MNSGEKGKLGMGRSNRGISNRRKVVLIWLFVLFFILGCPDDLPCTTESHPHDEQSQFIHARKNMIETQIRLRGIKDERLLGAMFKVKRHLFVPAHLQNLAYSDCPLPIGEGQTISQPYIVAIMTELLNLDGDEKVLEIGTGSGYQAAILAELANEVYTIEILEPLAEQSEKILNDLGYENIIAKCGDGYRGWEEYAPFDAIIVTCAPTYIPQPLLDQLAEGGRMVIPVGALWQELKLVEKVNAQIKTSNVIPVRFVPMTEKKDE